MSCNKNYQQKFDEKLKIWVFITLKFSSYNNSSANIRLDEDVLKTSFVFIFRRRLQDVFIKTNIFVLIIRLDHTSSRSLQDVLKTSSRRLAKMPSRCWRIIRLNYLTRSRICLGDTSEKFMVSVENVISVNVTPLL